MNALIWLLRGILFVVLLGLAIKNGNDVELRFYFDAVWRAPLSAVILLALVFGVALGMLALLPKLTRQRRELARRRRDAADAERTAG